MQNTITLNGKSYPTENVELHLPVVDETRLLYMAVESETEAGGFGLWEIELALLDDIDDLDCKRIHVRPDGETYDDDTLGTDIIGADMFTDLNYWSAGDDGYCYGDILVDFKRIEGRTYHVHVECALTDSDEDPEDLSPEDFQHTGSADFIVTVDEENPTE